MGAPLIFKSELPIARELRGWSLKTDGAPLILESELPITRELRGWSLGLMGRPSFINQNFLSPAISEDGAWD